MRLHWAVKAKLTKSHRQTALKTLQQLGASKPELPIDVYLTRIAPRQLDSDNLSSGFKAVRDGVADWLGIDDGHPGIAWHYKQRVGEPKTYFVELEII